MKAFWSRLGACVACIGGGLLSGMPNASAEGIGLVGAKLAAVQTTADLFVFFHFAPIGEEKQADGTEVTSFKPTGEAFKALVTLGVTTDGGGTIQKLHLVVARSFIDDPKKSVFAADLVKSFLASAAPTSASDDVGSLAREINARAMTGSSATVLTAQPPPQMPATPSAAYRTYAGDAQPQTLFYPSGQWQVVLQNESAGQGPVLDLVVSAKPE